MSDAVAAALASLNQSIKHLDSSISSNGNKAEVATSVIADLSAMVHELATAVHEVAEAIPPGKGIENGTPDNAG